MTTTIAAGLDRCAVSRPPGRPVTGPSYPVALDRSGGGPARAAAGGPGQGRVLLQGIGGRR